MPHNTVICTRPRRAGTHEFQNGVWQPPAILSLDRILGTVALLQVRTLLRYSAWADSSSLLCGGARQLRADRSGQGGRGKCTSGSDPDSEQTNACTKTIVDGCVIARVVAVRRTRRWRRRPVR